MQIYLVTYRQVMRRLGAKVLIELVGTCTNYLPNPLGSFTTVQY
jgi:hypothetical protein